MIKGYEEVESSIYFLAINIVNYIEFSLITFWNVCDKSVYIN